MTDFDYLVDKIRTAEFRTEPFRHVYIPDFFSPEHFRQIISSDEISSPTARNDRELIDGLHTKGFKAIDFPGCVTDVDKYIKWHSEGKSTRHHTACEGFGMAMRLYGMTTPILNAVNEFLASETFNRSIAEKFGLNYDAVLVDGGIQKYLDGYEISPHPDNRKKAATFMVNINPNPASETMNHHTHYMRLKRSREYVKLFWETNEDCERGWVPWEWTDSIYQQTANNSIVLFSPSNDTLHAVKADYDHLATQRTQLYGNLWYRAYQTRGEVTWEDLDLPAKAGALGRKRPSGVKGLVPTFARNAVKSLIGKSKPIGERNYQKSKTL